jgi:hypothetical protein
LLSEAVRAHATHLDMRVGDAPELLHRIRDAERVQVGALEVANKAATNAHVVVEAE